MVIVGYHVNLVNPSGPHGNTSKDMPNTRYLKLNMSQMVKVDGSSMDTFVY